MFTWNCYPFEPNLVKLFTHPIILIHLQIVNEKTRSKHKTEKMRRKSNMRSIIKIIDLITVECILRKRI